MKLNRIDAIVAAAILLTIMLTVLLFLAIDGPAVEVRDFTIEEIPSAQPPPPAPPHVPI